MGIDWSLGTNGFVVQFDADEREGLLPAVQSEAPKLGRLLLEGSGSAGKSGAGKELDWMEARG